MRESSNRPGGQPTQASGTHARSAGSPVVARLDYVLALLAALLAFALYIRTLAPGLLGGDSGEFQFAAWLGGFAHPTGYPLYLMLGWLWTHLLPVHDPAWRMNAFSALWGGVAIGLMYLLALRVLWLVSPPQRGRGMQGAALFAALVFAVTPTFWSQATVAEVYTLNATFVAAILLGLITWGQTGSRRALYLTALLYGLSLAHHRTTLLYLPAIVAYAVQVWRSAEQKRAGAAGGSRAPRPRFRVLASVLGLVCLPLLLYAYIPLRAPHVSYYQVRLGPNQMLQLYTPTLAGFIEHISGQGFGSALGVGGIAAARLKGLPALFTRELTVVSLVLGLLGLAWLAARARPLLTLTGLSFLAVVGFNLIYGIGDIYGYYIPAYLIWIVWMAVGIQGISELAGRRVSTPLTRLFISLLALALPVYLLSANFTSHDRSRDATSLAWDTLLTQPTPQNAVLVTNDRDEMVPQWYLKYVEGRRADLTGLFPLIQPGPEWADVGAVTDQALRSGRPVYLIKAMDGLEVKFDLLPEAALVRVLGPAAAHAPAEPAGQTFGDAIRLAGYTVTPAKIAPGGAAEIVLHWQPITRLDTDYTTFVHLVNADGVKIAQSDHRPGGVYYPTSLWKPGETLSDRHTLSLPTDLGRAPYTIVVGLYDSAAGLQHLGEPQPIGTMAQ